jgi:hypothetical protein
MKKPQKGAKELQETLQGVHNVTIGTWYVISSFATNHFVNFVCWLLNHEPTICRLLYCMTCILAHLVEGGRRQHQVVDG